MRTYPGGIMLGGHGNAEGSSIVKRYKDPEDLPLGVSCATLLCFPSYPIKLTFSVIDVLEAGQSEKIVAMWRFTEIARIVVES